VALMAIKGSLKEASLPDVLQLLSMGKKTGCLSVTHRNNFGSIYFDKGKICYAAIVNRRDRLGDILVKSAAITAEQLESAIAVQAKERDRRLGEILVGLNLISRDELHQQIRVQIEEAVFFLFTWTQGSFNFESDISPEEQDFLVSISPESLLLEGAQRVDEWSLIEKKIPSFDIVFSIDRERAEASAEQLTREQRVLLPLIDGKRDVAALTEESGFVEFDVGKALFGLVTAGFLHRVGKSRPPDVIATESQVEEHRNLGVAFYRTGMLDEADREFRRVCELRPGDQHARFFLGLVHLRLGRWDDAVGDFEHASQARQVAPAVFHNLAFAYEQLGQLAKAKEALREAMQRGGDRDAGVHTSLGVLALREGDLAAANASFLAARPLYAPRAPSAAWFHYASLSAALAGRVDEAIQTLSEGTRAHPHAAVLQNNLAVALERQRRFPEAFAALERGVAEDPTVAQLHKNLGDHHYRQARLEEAFDSYQRAVKYNEKLGADVWLRLGNIRLKRNERAEAVTCWERALAIDPDSQVVRRNLEAARAMP
jgi:tetratricopeptide (TPR) repeat protein